MANSKDVLFKSKVNNYIGEKLSQNTTPPAFSVTNDGNGNFTVGKFNGDVTLTLVSTDYVFTPTRGDAVTISSAGVTSIVVDFITLNVDAATLNGMTITGAGIVNISAFEGMPQADLSGVSTSILTANIIGGSTEPLLLTTSTFGTPVIGSIINITSGEVILDAGLVISSNTSIVVDESATLTLTATQAQNATIKGMGDSVVLGDEGNQDIIINTQGTNSITGGAGADTIELGDGTDTLYYGLGDNDSNSDSLISGYDTIKNFEVGTDKITLKSVTSGTSVSIPTSLTRFGDVEGASITSEQNLIDNVLKSASFSTLEVNEAGITVVTSGTYAGAYLYVNDAIAALDENKDLFIKMIDTTNLGAVGSLTASNYFVQATETFTVTNTDEVITFAGTATGSISLSIDSNIVTFTKGSVTAATTFYIDDITKITLASGQTIIDSAADLTDIIIDGEGSVVVTGSVGDQTLNIWTSGTNSITGGTGSDTIWLGDAAVNAGVDTIIIQSGDSAAATPDEIYFFELDKDKLDLPSTTIASDAASGTGSLVEDETVGVVTIGQMSIANGIVTFQAADDTTSVNIDSIDAFTAAVSYLSSQISDGDTVAFEYYIDSEQQGTYIFQGNASEDIVVNLIGTTVTDLSAIII